ncbi:MAG: CofH family radical SAM protein, partial [Nannocystaceae bacterium]|nr:CofH family radical SAM protein [Nannocystaceae bacterium]
MTTPTESSDTNHGANHGANNGSRTEPSTGAKPLRLLAVSFLNAWPLFRSLTDCRPEKIPSNAAGEPLFSVNEALPSACAEALANGDADVALVPVAALLDHPEWEVVPEIAIAARGAVQTVVVASDVPLSEVRRIHLDMASRTSAALMRVILAERGLHPELIDAPHGAGADMIHETDGALVIGDAAFGLADHHSHILDLGDAWFSATGLPLVFAVWAARPGALSPAHVKALQAARDAGTKKSEALARTFRQQRLDADANAEVLSEASYADYLRRSIRYRLDAYAREGLVELLTRIENHRGRTKPVHVHFFAEPHATIAPSSTPGHTRHFDCEALLEKGAAGGRLDPAEGMVLYDHAELWSLGRAADQRRQALHPDGVVTYIVDRNVNYTNVCTARCKFCNFYTPPGGRNAYELSRDVLAQKFAETEALGGIQILLQGGLNPDLGLSWYEDLFRWTKANFKLALHALSPTEIVHLANLEDMEIRDVLSRLRAAGMDSLPGGGAEMLHEEIRGRISPFKNSTEEWLEVMRQAHRLGMISTATMVFGFQETAEHVITHFNRLRDVQDEALANPVFEPGRDKPGRFTAFITWPFQADGTRLKLRDDTSPWRYLRLQALARLYFDNIDNIQVSWPTLGPQVGEVALRFGANDFGSVMIEENVVSQAGAHFMLTAEQIEHHIRQAGQTSSRRTVHYDRIATPSG